MAKTKTKSKTKNSGFDGAKMITDKIIAQLEQGIIPWEQPWIGRYGNVARSGNTGKPYSLLNQMSVGLPGRYFTRNQANKLGAVVKAGAERKYVYNVGTKPIKKMNPETGEEEIVFWKSYFRYWEVFNEIDIDGLPESETEIRFENDDIPDCENVINEYITREGITLKHGSDRAYYNFVKDEIVLPCKDQFEIGAEYYSTAFHEMTHSTGHESRLNRFGDETKSKIAFGNEEYSREELVAEMGSAFLLNACGVENEHASRNNVAYIQNWLNVLKGDKNMIVKAATKAEKAVDFIFGVEEETENG